ncbi:MAG: hypothetical protein ABW252_20855 [Polyangiales bacterium]
MRTLRFEHLPSGQRFVVDAASTRVFGVDAGVETITRADRIADARCGVRASDLRDVARDFELLYKWAAPGTRFPSTPPDGAPPDGWFASLAGRLNQQGAEGDLVFHGYLDRIEERLLDAGEPVRVVRTPLHQHLAVLDYERRGVLGFRALYRAFVASRLSPVRAAIKALGALLVFGRGRPVAIAAIDARRPQARTGAYDARGAIDPEVVRQYRRLFDGTAADELAQPALARFNALNFQGGSISNAQWKTFFATCSALNLRDTVTFAQLSALFDGSFSVLAASKADRRGRRPLDRALRE